MALAGLPMAQTSSRADTPAAALAKVVVLDNDILYLRAGHVGKNLAEEIQSAQGALAATNEIIGTVLDLRFADGDDSDAAKAAADLFAAKKLPLTILVNGETRDAAVRLAELLRDAHEGLIFGGATGGTKSWGPVQPDIAVKVSLDEDRALIENPYAAPTLNETNSPAATNNLLPFVDYTSEADLVRAKIKDGDEGENPPPLRKTEPPRPFIRDPVLARAVDLIKGLAVVRASHS
jgi:C-terminal processing protease CtpA/Prc